MKNTPKYCRLSRVVRDIPSQEIVAGNKSTNLREVVEKELKQEDNPCKCIRCREIRNKKIKSVKYNITQYNTTSGKEFFISADTPKERLAGFLRLNIPQKQFLDELDQSSIIREIHVYGKVTEIDQDSEEKVQHKGIGKELIKIVEEISRKNNKNKISVISAVGTREYYKKQRFKKGKLYQYKILK
jgi:elongator complex protein 3